MKIRMSWRISSLVVLTERQGPQPNVAYPYSFSRVLGCGPWHPQNTGYKRVTQPSGVEGSWFCTRDPLCFYLFSREGDLWSRLHSVMTLPTPAAAGENTDEQSQEQVARKHRGLGLSREGRTGLGSVGWDKQQPPAALRGHGSVHLCAGPRANTGQVLPIIMKTLTVKQACQ